MGALDRLHDDIEHSAQIPGSVSSLDPVFPESERGVPLGTLLRAR